MRNIGNDFLEGTSGDSRNPLVSLYRLINIDDDGTDLYFTDHSEDINFESETYQALPFQKPQIRENSDNEIDSMTVTIADGEGNLAKLMDRFDGFRNIKVEIITGLKNQLNNPLLRTRDIYQIDRSQKAPFTVSFTLSFFKEFDDTTPRRNYSRSHCQWTYTKEGCFRKSNHAEGELRVSLISGDDFCFVENPFIFNVGDLIIVDDGTNQQSFTITDITVHNQRLDLDQTSNFNFSGGTPVLAGLRTVLEGDIERGDQTILVDDNTQFSQRETFIVSGTDNSGNFHIQEFAISGTIGSNQIITLNKAEHFFSSGTTIKRKYFTPQSFSNVGVDCDKKLDSPNGCEFHNNDPRFGAFKSVPSNSRLTL